MMLTLWFYTWHTPSLVCTLFNLALILLTVQDTSNTLSKPTPPFSFLTQGQCFTSSSPFSQFAMLMPAGSCWSLARQRTARGAPGAWGYGDENGPLTWGGICQTGQSQSPIDIVRLDSVPSNMTEFRFDDNYKKPIQLEALNNGHSLLLRPHSTAEAPSFTGGGFTQRYRLEQMHFHWGHSEHTVDGESADLELHLVHYNTKYGNVATAISHEDGLAVIGILYKKSNNLDDTVEDVLRSALDALDNDETLASGGDEGEGVEEEGEVEELTHERHERAVSGGEYRPLDKKYSILNLLPDDIEPWFRYDGSLTTPTCDETVTWTVINQWSTISAELLKDLQELVASDGSTLVDNYRPPQPLYRRQVLRQGQLPDNTATSLVITNLMLPICFTSFLLNIR